MNPTSFFKSLMERKWYIPALILISPLLYLHIGLPAIVSVGDGVEYNAFATSILGGHGYTMDGLTFSDAREPGYPVFLAFLYAFVGVMNLQAISIIQPLLIGLVGILAYLFLTRLDHPYLGALAGFSIALWPPSGLAAHDIATESLFTLLLACLFLLAQKILEKNGSAAHLFFWFGLLCGCTTLVRSQLVFFLPFIIVCYLLFYRLSWRTMATNIAYAVVPFMLVVGGWVLLVHEYTGHFIITEGRPELALYDRAVRSELSYRQTTQYGVDWIKRSMNSGEASDFLDQYDPHQLSIEYAALATSTKAVAALKKWSIATILANPGHYLYGNVVELMKLNYIHHDYTDTINRYVRAGVFVLLYALFLFGVYQFFKKGDRRIKASILLALIFIIYNWLALTPLETIPRFNIPYAQFYILVGVLGIILWLERRKGTKNI